MSDGLLQAFIMNLGLRSRGICLFHVVKVKTAQLLHQRVINKILISWKNFRKALIYSFTLWFVAGCASLPDSSPTKRMKEAKRALQANEIDHAEYFRALIRAHLEESREKFDQRRILMARSYQTESILDPPVHSRLYQQLEEALEKEQISRANFEELQGYVRILHAEWVKRRSKVSRDRFRWGYPR